MAFLGLWVGLAASAKYPGAMVALSVAAATWTCYRRQRGLWLLHSLVAALASVGALAALVLVGLPPRSFFGDAPVAESSIAEAGVTQIAVGDPSEARTSLIRLGRAGVEQHLKAWPMEIASDDTGNVSRWFRGKMAFSVPIPELSGKGYRVIGGRLSNLSEPGSKSAIFSGQNVALRSLSNRLDDLSTFEWLGDEVVCAIPHGFDSEFHGGVGSHQHHLAPGRKFLDCPQELHAVHPRHLQVGQHNLYTAGLQ